MGLLGRRRIAQRHAGDDARNAEIAAAPGNRLQELELQQMQDEMELNEILRPQMLKNLGLMEEIGEDGTKTVRLMTEDEKIAAMTPEEKSTYETEQLIAERQAKAARGELEVPSYVEDELARQREIQKNVSSQRLGAKGANLSTGGINTKVNQFGNELAVKNAYQSGQESTGMGLLGNYNQYLGNQAASAQNVYGGFSNAGINILPMAQTAMQPYTFAKQLQDEQGLLDQSRKNAVSGGILSGIGSAASMYLTRGTGGSR